MKNVFTKVSLYLFLLINLTMVGACSSDADHSNSSAAPLEKEVEMENENTLSPKHTEIYFPNENIDEFSRNWYGHFLHEMGEEPLVKSKRKKDITYRFLWLRSFHSPIIIRIHENKKGAIYLHVKVSGGAGGYEPGRIIRDEKVTLTGEQWAQVVLLFSKAKICTEKPKSTMMMDGAQWVFESHIKNQYCFVDVQSPRVGAYRELGMYLLSISPLEEPDYQPVY